MTAGKQLGQLTTHTHTPHTPPTHSGSVCSSFQYMKSQGTGRGKSSPTGCTAPTTQPIVLTTLATPVTVAPSCSCSQARLDSVCFITGSSVHRPTQICQLGIFEKVMNIVDTIKLAMNIVDTLYKIKTCYKTQSLSSGSCTAHSQPRPGGTNNKGRGVC